MVRESASVVLVVAFAFALCAGALLLAAPLAAGVAVLGVVALARRRRAMAVVILLGLGIGALRAHIVRDRADADRRGADAALPRRARCAGNAIVTSSPVRRGDSLQWTAEATEVDCGEGPPSGPWTIALFGGPADLARGDEVSFVAELAPPERFDDPELGDSTARAARRPVVRSGGALDVTRRRRGARLATIVDRARAHVRARIDATYPGDVAPMARALVLGESDLDAGDDAAFRASGLSHLLAVSGMHLVLVVASIVKLGRALLARTRLARSMDVGRLAALVGLPITWLYADFSGGSGSAMRAAWMLTVHLVLRAIARRTDAWRSLAISVLGFSMVDPLAIHDVSFVLSAAATFGLLAFSKRLDEAIAERVTFVPRTIVRSLAATAAATIACAPVIAAMSGTVSLVGLVANLVAVPVGETAALPMCLLHALLSPLPAAESGTATVAAGALFLTRAIARIAALVPTLPVPTPTNLELAVIAVAVFGVAAKRLRSPGLLAIGGLLLLIEVGTRAEAHPHGRLRATFFDVGQGDSALVDLPDGSALLVDGGGLVGSPVDVGQRVVGPMLSVRRRGSLRAVILSHPHPDHYGGLPAALRGVDAAELWDTGQGEREGTGGAYATLLSHFGTERVRRPDTLCGHHEIGGAEVDVLAPCPSPDPGRGPNDNSFVVRFRYGRRAFLFVGDAEHEEEAELVERAPELLRADVLKVGHHGSRTSSTGAFLDAVKPSVAVTSTGVRNRFGHPHPNTLASLDQRRIRTFRTDRDGAVVVSTDGESLDVSAAR